MQTNVRSYAKEMMAIKVCHEGKIVDAFGSPEPLSAFDLNLSHAVPRKNTHVKTISAAHIPAKNSPRLTRVFIDSASLKEGRSGVGGNR
jgi:hypothetical protein